MPVTFSEFRYFSVTADCEMVRLSMTDAHNREFWNAIPASDGKNYRARRDACLETLAEAIDMGLQPGRVRVRS